MQQNVKTSHGFHSQVVQKSQDSADFEVIRQRFAETGQYLAGNRRIPGICKVFGKVIFGYIIYEIVSGHMAQKPSTKENQHGKI